MTLQPLGSSPTGSTSTSSVSANDASVSTSRQLSPTASKTENLANGILTKEQLTTILNKSEGHSWLPTMLRGKTGYTKSVSKVAQEYLTALNTGHSEKIQETGQKLSEVLKTYRENKTGKKNWLVKKITGKSDQAKLDNLDSVERHLGVIKLEGLLASHANMQEVSEQIDEIMKNLLTSIPRNDQEIARASKEISTLLEKHGHAIKDVTITKLRTVLLNESVSSTVSIIEQNRTDNIDSNIDQVELLAKTKLLFSNSGNCGDFLEIIKKGEMFDFFHRGLTASFSVDDFYGACLMGIYEKLENGKKLDKKDLHIFNSIAKACTANKPPTNLSKKNVKSFIEREFLVSSNVEGSSSFDEPKNHALNLNQADKEKYFTDPKSKERLQTALLLQFQTNIRPDTINKCIPRPPP